MAIMGELKPPPKRLVRDLWVRMAGMYGYKWTSAFGDSPEHGDDSGHTPGDLTIAGEMWSLALAGLSRAQVAQGIRRCLVSSDRYIPSAPEFRALAMGIPTEARVRLVIKDINKLEDPQLLSFCRLVWTFIDGWRFRTADRHTEAMMVRDAYELAREHVMAGGGLPAPPAGALGHDEPPEPKFTPPGEAPPESVEAERRRIQELLEGDLDWTDKLGDLDDNPAADKPDLRTYAERDERT